MEKLWVFDAHCDTISRCWREYEDLDRNGGALDLERTEDAFGRYCQFFALWTSEGFTGGNTVEMAFEALLRCFRRQMERNSARIVPCCTWEEAEKAQRAGKAAAFLTVEGAELLGCSLEGVDRAAREGVVSITLTWNHANALSGSHSDQAERGLTPLGRAFLARMEERRILADVSHLSETGFWDVMALSTRPVLATHSNSRGVWDHTRNLTDAQITAIIKNQGVIGLNFYRQFVGGGENLAGVREHLERILSLGGAANVALGGDWDGCDTISDLGDITDLTKLYEYLLRCNYPETVLRDLFYNNLKRVVSQR